MPSKVVTPSSLANMQFLMMLSMQFGAGHCAGDLVPEPGWHPICHLNRWVCQERNQTRIAEEMLGFQTETDMRKRSREEGDEEGKDGEGKMKKEI